MLRDDEIIIFSMNEESRNISLFDMISDRVKMFDIELVLN